MTPLAPIHAPPCFFPDVCGGEGGDPVQAIRETPPPARRGFTQADQVNLLVSASEADADLGFMARMLVLCRLGVFFVLTFALLAQSAWGQRIGPLVLDNQQRSKTSSAARAAAVRPPSLQLSLSPPAEVALPPLGPDDLQSLQPQEGRPPVIGVHRRLPEGALKLSFSRGGVKSTAEGAWQSTEAGRLWRLKMISPSARAMRVHFRDFAIGSGSLWIHSEDGQTVGPYTGSGLYGDGDFWSGIVFGDSLTIEYLPDPAGAGEAVPFQIVAISHIWSDAFGEGAEGGARLPEAAWGAGVKSLPGRIDLAVGTPSKRARLTTATKAIQLVERSATLEPPRPKAETQLTPGQPVSFTVGPVDSTTLFNGSPFLLEVPEDASRVTFTLKSDPNVDVDLYVRFGQNIELQGTRPVYDYASEGLAGTEEIVITPQSDPPLRAGTYYVAVGLFATGVVVNCTLTAEVERKDLPQISGGTLTPGQPAPFRLGPVDSPLLFIGGDNSFQLEVPEDATRITFTLESDVDVELYVRYGENIVRQDGELLYDYKDRNRTGNERILITPQSDPPLRAGTYFIGIAVWATGVVAEGTLTAEVELEGEAPPMISGGTLTPGQPADFRLGPVDSPTLFNRNYSFRLEAPDNATRITFTLESVDPDVDVVLYVRYGEDNTIQDGRPVFDHGSRNPDGNERIGITRRSDPPLRAGTYFVSVLVFDTGVVAEGTLTAAVETDAADCHLDVTCYPEWSSSATGVARIYFETSEGGSSRCSGTLLNNRRQDLTPYFLTAAHCVQTEEAARSVTAFWSYQTQTCNGDLPELRSVPQTEGAGLLSTLGGGGRNPEGDMTLLQLEGDLPDGVMFQGWDADPQPVGAQVTGIHHPGSADWGVFKRISFGQIIPDPGFGTSDDTYAIVRYTQGLVEGGSSGSALFSSSETVVGVQSFGRPKVYDCSSGPFYSGATHFSVFYPHVRPFIDSTLPEITGGTLAPGQPAAFRLGPVDAPMLFSGDSSFQMEVPEGAARVTFTLESVDPDVNVDLYVRYGEDNAIQGGNVVSDYSSTGPTGNEQIVVTRDSDPPLRAGTYFVSLMLRTTGAVAEVTLTAKFDAPLPAGGQIYYFPHLAVGASWQTTITYINYSREEVTCQTDFISDHGTPLMVSFAELGTVDSRTDVLPPGGSVHQETNVDLSASLAPGWARATCSGPVKASLLFRRRNSEGAPTAEAGVNAAAVPATRFVTFAEQGEGQFGTGVAYANPSATAALVTFTARDTAGEVLPSVVRTLPPGGHAAHGMSELFDLTSFTGSIEVTSTEPIVSLSLNFEADPVFSSLPPGELDASAQGSTTYYFPHLAVGASWQTTITYINYSPEEVTCQTDFISDHGTPLMVSFAALGTVVSRTDVLPPGGSVHQETNVDLSAPLAPGWAWATCSGPVKASLLFRRRNSEGAPTAEAGVNAAAVPATRFVTFAEQGEGQFGTGVAYANPSATAALVTFTARDTAGEVLPSVNRTLSPGGHAAHGMSELFDLTNFTGSIEVTSTEPIVSLSLNFEADPVFSSLPPGEAPAVTTPSVSVTYPADHGTIFISDQVQFLATVPSSGGGPQAATDAVWESDAPAVATVSSSGLLTAVSAGEATISAEVTPGERGSLRIRVFPKFHGHWEGNLNFTRQTVSPDWREFGAEECEGLDNCGWVPLAADFTQDGAAVTGSVRTTFSAPPNFEWTVQGDVSIDGTLNLTFDEIALPIEAPIEVRQTYISWKSRADAPGVMTGTAAQQISSDALSGNILSEGCLGRAYKRRECSGWQSSDSPDPMFAPANEAAFNNLVVGKRISSGVPNYYTDFVSPGRFRETAGTDIWTGSYTYRNTGSNTGTVTLNYDDGDRCTFHLTFASATAGTGTFTCNDGESGEFNWRLVEIPASGAPDLVIQTPSVSDSSPNAGGSFTLSATVRNQGNGLSASTTLRYYRSPDATISTGDMEVGTDAVSALTPAGASDGSISLTAPSTAGTYYYGACVDPVSGESATGNNCSTAVTVTVASSGDGDDDTNQACATGRTIESGSECALQYPQGSPDAGLQFGRFAVGVQLGSEKGCLYIGAGFLACGSSSISRDLTFTTGSGNEYSFGFAASKIEDSSSWRISKLSITLQE